MLKLVYVDCDIKLCIPAYRSRIGAVITTTIFRLAVVGSTCLFTTIHIIVCGLLFVVWVFLFSLCFPNLYSGFSSKWGCIVCVVVLSVKSVFFNYLFIYLSMQKPLSFYFWSLEFKYKINYIHHITSLEWSDVVMSRLHSSRLRFHLRDIIIIIKFWIYLFCVISHNFPAVTKRSPKAFSNPKPRLYGGYVKAKKLLRPLHCGLYVNA